MFLCQIWCTWDPVTTGQRECVCVCVCVCACACVCMCVHVRWLVDGLTGGKWSTSACQLGQGFANDRASSFLRFEGKPFMDKIGLTPFGGGGRGAGRGTLRIVTDAACLLSSQRLSTTSIPFTVLSMNHNPCYEDFLIVCGLKEAQLLVINPSGQVTQRAMLHPSVDGDGYIVKVSLRG